MMEPMEKTPQIALTTRMAVLGLLLFCCLLSGGCGSRSLTEKDVVGTYEADADWGKSMLILHPDHSFEQRVLRNDHTQSSVTGTWQLSMYAGKDASGGGIHFRPVFLAVAHDQKGDLVDGNSNSISRGFFWGITIGADPDWGISFEKE